jgi:ABC-type multidrug transport system ATPase subunit
VEQNDIHMPLITVKESLEFSSALRLPKGTSAARRQQFMQQVKHNLIKKLRGKYLFRLLKIANYFNQLH